MIELEQALARIAGAIQPLPCELIALHESAHRHLAQDIVAPISLPPFDNSAMDGYALRAEDVGKASFEQPAQLKLIGAVAAGAQFTGTIAPGTCIRIFTGSPMPRGADAVVMQEDTRAAGETVAVLDAVKPWENVRFAGQDVKQGAVVGRAGDHLSAARIALLGALGLERIAAHQRPVVQIVSTGTELVEPGNPLRPGQIYESNRTAISSLAESVGAKTILSPLVPDTLEATTGALRAAFERSDAVITTGGASVGEHDFVKAAFESMGGSLDFWRVAIKPGKPFVFGKLGKKFLFGLPGNPVSAFVTFLLLVRPALSKLQGATDLELPAFPGVLEEPIQNRGERRHFMRVVVDKRGRIKSAGLQASHALASLAGANGLLDLPPNVSWPAGKQVYALRWES